MIKDSNTIDTTDDTIFTANAVIFWSANVDQFLIVQENDGQWGLAGGAKDLDDLDITATLKRELEEELSLEPADYKFSIAETKIEFVYDHRSSTRFGKKGVIVFFIIELLNPDKIRPSAELNDIAWVSVTEALEKLRFSEVKEGFKKVINEIK